jgi:hypothetical protein
MAFLRQRFINLELLDVLKGPSGEIQGGENKLKRSILVNYIKVSLLFLILKGQPSRETQKRVLASKQQLK